jgi:hypothetical protein
VAKTTTRQAGRESALSASPSEEGKMRETLVVDYDPADDVSVTARSQLRELLVMMARWRDRGVLPSREQVAAFNATFNEMCGPAQEDPRTLAVVLVELLLAVHRAMGLFAQIGECSAEGILREIIC